MSWRASLIAGVILLCMALCSLTFAQTADDDSASSQSSQSGSSPERQAEMSSSKDTRIDLSPPRNDTKDHPNSSVSLNDGDDTPSDVGEMHPWDPHRAAKDIEVGDYYFK